MKNNEVKFTLPLLPEPRTVRVKFRKVGNLQYISHLDLQRSFARILVRAGLPLWYTKGFNPHIKMVFGMPLPVGTESECEYLDLRIEREMSDAEIMARLNAELTEELAVLAVYPAVRKFTDMAFAAYDYTVRSPHVDEALLSRVRDALATHPLEVVKRTKSGEKTVDILDFIHTVTACIDESGALCLSAVLAAGEGNYLNPELLVTALARETGLLSGEPDRDFVRIVRRRVLLADGVTEFA